MVRVVVHATSPDPTAIETAAAAIRAGGLVVLPTDTLYGLAADPFNRTAVRRVFAAKRRAAGQPLPLIAADTAQVVRHIGALSTAAERLARRFWPGPLTLLLRAPDSLASETTGGTGLVGVRVPNHHVALALCRASDRPLTATSANISGQPASPDPNAVLAALSGEEARIDVLLDAGKTAGGPPSTIVDMSEDVARLVRAGAIPWEEIQTCLNT